MDDWPFSQGTGLRLTPVALTGTWTSDATEHWERRDFKATAQSSTPLAVVTLAKYGDDIYWAKVSEIYEAVGFGVAFRREDRTAATAFVSAFGARDGISPSFPVPVSDLAQLEIEVPAATTTGQPWIAWELPESQFGIGFLFVNGSDLSRGRGHHWRLQDASRLPPPWDAVLGSGRSGTLHYRQDSH